MTWEQSVCGKVEVDSGARYASGHGSKGITSEPDLLATCNEVDPKTGPLVWGGIFENKDRFTLTH